MNTSIVNKDGESSHVTPSPSDSISNPTPTPTVTLPTVSLSTSADTVSEGVGTVTISLTASAASTQTISVPYSLSGTATLTTDYSINSAGTLTITPGNTSTSIIFTVVDDGIIESDETVILTLGTPSNADLGTTTNYQLLITNNDVAVTYTVSKVYPTNGANWNDYIKYSAATTAYDQSDTACVGTETGLYGQLNGCLHGGEKLKVIVTGRTSCTGLTISDTLGAFDWKCLVRGGVATFFTIGLKDQKGLADLVNATSWKNNSVTVQDSGSTIGTSTPATWWTNPVVALPDNSNIASATIILDGTDNDGAGVDQAYAAGTIFTLASSRQTSGYNINADKYSIVTLGSAQLSFNGQTADGCDYTTGEWGAGANTTIVCSGSQKFVWIEGAFIGQSNLSTLTPAQIVLTSFSKMNNVRISNSTYEGIWLYKSTKNMFKNLNVSRNAGNPLITLDTSSKNSFYNVRLADTASATSAWGALDITNNSDSNIFYNMNISNSGGFGIHIQGGNSNILTKIVVSSTIEKGIECTGTTSNSGRQTYNHITVANTDRTALHFEGSTNGSDYNTLNQILTANHNTYGGIFLLGVTNYIVSQVLTAHSSDPGLYFNNTDNSQLTNNILLGNNSGCNQGFGTNPGVTNACANQGTSNANIINDNTLINLTNSFVGKVTSDANPNDTTGTAAYNTITDFLTFNNFFRSWGADGSGAFPHTTQRTDCSGTATCRIWDWSLKSTDTVARNKSLDGANANAAFVANSTCPAAVHGNKALTDQQTSPHTFLINAVEIAGDEIGNDNGLCESNEACIYSPNFGAYQGSGNYLTNGTCTFVDGTVAGVTMYAYPVNGE